NRVNVRSERPGRRRRKSLLTRTVHPSMRLVSYSEAGGKLGGSERRAMTWRPIPRERRARETRSTTGHHHRLTRHMSSPDRESPSSYATIEGKVSLPSGRVEVGQARSRTVGPVLSQKAVALARSRLRPGRKWYK